MGVCAFAAGIGFAKIMFAVVAVAAGIGRCGEMPFQSKVIAPSLPFDWIV
jgi:hypothetical protein